MFYNRQKNEHPAASGRFAAYGEIVSDFCYLPLDLKRGDSLKMRQNRPAGAKKTGGILNSKIAALAVSLLSAIIITVYLNKTEISPGLIFIEYAVLWGALFLLLTFFRNRINNLISGQHKSRSQKIDYKILPARFKNIIGKKRLNQTDLFNIYKQDKPFNLGMLEGDKILPDLLIGLDAQKRFEHILLVSPTGGGKTSRYIVPNIINDASYKNLSVFTIDIDSPYLYGAVKNDWALQGKRVINFDPYNAGGGPKAHFNPLTERGKTYLADDKLYNLSSLLFYPDRSEINGGDIHAHRYYAKRSSDIFYACLLYLKYRYDIKYFNLVTVKSFFEKGGKFIESEIGKFNGENNKKIKELFTNFFELPMFERAKIITDILNTLDFLNDENAADSFRSRTGLNHDEAGNNEASGQEFFIGDFFENDILFITGIPKERINSGGAKLMSFMVNIFINAIYEHRRAGLRAGDNQCLDKNESRDIFMYLDEFPALSLNNFDIELANLRKTRTGVCLTAQDISFIKSRYGDISLIASNVGTHIVMGHASHETCEYYSERIGEKYVYHKEFIKNSFSGNNFLDAELNNSIREVPVASGLYPLMPAGEIKNMDRNSVLIYTKYINPFILNISNLPKIQ